MSLLLLGFRSSTFIAWPPHQGEPTDATSQQFAAAESQAKVLDEFGVHLRQPLAELLPECWIANRTQPVAGWSAPVWNPEVETIDQDVLRYPTELLRSRLPAALALTNAIVDERERLRVSNILERIVETAARIEAEGEQLYLLVSA